MESCIHVGREQRSDSRRLEWKIDAIRRDAPLRGFSRPTESCIHVGREQRSESRRLELGRSMPFGGMRRCAASPALRSRASM